MMEKKERKNSAEKQKNDISESKSEKDKQLKSKVSDERIVSPNEENLKKQDDDNKIIKEEELNKEIEKLMEEKLRLLAEMENLRKRSDKERIDSIKFGSMNLARDILSPGDNLTRALDAIPQEEKKSDTVKNLIDGLNMVQKEFASILERHGVKKIEAINCKFDHNFHQAMVEIENDEVDEGMIVQEMQSGYIMHDRLLRPSMVAVAKKSLKKDTGKKND